MDYTLTLWTNYKGSPLIVMENNKPTMIGMFSKLVRSSSTFQLYDKIDADVFQWIVEHADGIYDSECKVYKSCRCGRHNTIGHYFNDLISPQNKGKRKKRNIESRTQEAVEQQYTMSNNSNTNYMRQRSSQTFNRIFDRRDQTVKDKDYDYVDDEPMGYPWTVRIFNRHVDRQESMDCHEEYASVYCYSEKTENERVVLQDIADNKLWHTLSYTECNGALITHQGGPPLDHLIFGSRSQGQ